jgi:two-component system response regulator ChvI
MITGIEDNVVNSAAAMSAAPHASRKAAPIRVLLLTNAGSGENLKEKLLDQGFAVQVFDDSSLRGPSAVDIDADLVVVERSLPGLSNIEAMAQVSFQGINAPVVLIKGSASLTKQANYSSDVVLRSHGVETPASALKLATFANPNEATPAEEHMTCGRLLLQRHDSRAFWNGVDLGCTIGEYRAIELLGSRPGHYFTYRAIYDRLRHEGFVAGDGPKGHWANVRSAIKRIRNKFSSFDPAFDEIENYSGFGYRWRKPD